ncbi:hypothetical protein SIM22_06050 [Bacillus cereus group sp. BfR-BA-01363]|uniref:hypothetical protein n=1 Tax=Bacillus cereus group sp. BfR-BA-01363 TaxID=3094882 RepID=UPI0029C351A3|nr:hypothetical protein [Bacillus cereus group sp. BfR-BA-01363]MDX5853666.1 hypothetical protein [Bacillus cereus group sp. BfR-BA-01363]
MFRFLKSILSKKKVSTTNSGADIPPSTIILTPKQWAEVLGIPYEEDSFLFKKINQREDSRITKSEFLSVNSIYHRSCLAVEISDLLGNNESIKNVTYAGTRVYIVSNDPLLGTFYMDIKRVPESVEDGYDK